MASNNLLECHLKVVNVHTHVFSRVVIVRCAERKSNDMVALCRSISSSYDEYLVLGYETCGERNVSAWPQASQARAPHELAKHHAANHKRRHLGSQS